MSYIRGHNNPRTHPGRWGTLTREQRFWDKVTKGDSCWTWNAAADAHGYGRVNWGGKTRLAHHVAYELIVGSIPDGMELMHDCDTPQCVRPGILHVRAGTHAENMRAMSIRGRAATKANGKHRSVV